MRYDFNVYDDGSVCLLAPVTDDAIRWVEYNTGDDILRMGHSVVVESRYIQDICYGILSDGLTIEKDRHNMIVGSDGDLVLE